jgi:hypothetical protein
MLFMARIIFMVRSNSERVIAVPFTVATIAPFDAADAEEFCWDDFFLLAPYETPFKAIMTERGTNNEQIIIFDLISIRMNLLCRVFSG